MSDGHALMRAILDDPDDDAPRLIYADWLEERGDSARASFIRAQVELARLPQDHVGRDRLVQIERGAWKQNRTAWTEWVPKWARFDRFHRGFLEEIRCEAADFFANAHEIRAETPLLSVWLDHAEHVAVPLFRGRALEGLRALRIRDNVAPGSWRILTESPYLSRLVKLQLGNCREPNQLIESLVASDALPELRTLRLKEFPLGDEPAARLVQHPWTSRLTVLDLSWNFIAQSEPFIASPYLHGLQQLNLRRNPVLDDRLAVDALKRRFGNRLRI